MGSCHYMFSSKRERGYNTPAACPAARSKPRLTALLRDRDRLQSPTRPQGARLSACLRSGGQKERTHRPWRGISQHSSAVTSDPDPPPSPNRAGQPEAGGAPLALAFPFACVGSSLLPVLGTSHAQWTPASGQACKSEVMRCLSLPCLRLSQELVFDLPAPHPAAFMRLYTQKVLFEEELACFEIILPFTLSAGPGKQLCVALHLLRCGKQVPKG